jgi:hypothetical protein
MRRLLLLPTLVLGLAAAFAISGNAARSGAATSAAASSGTIKALDAHSITVHSVVDITCRLTPQSPNLSRFGVGDRVKIVCADGVLKRIRNASAGPTVAHGQTTAPPVKSPDAQPAATQTNGNTYGFGAIAVLGPTSIGVIGERPLTCALGPASPRLGDFHVGDRVKVACQNGFLVAIAADSPTGPPATTSAPTTTSATTTAGGNGTLTALTPTSLTVTGDRSLTCSVGSSSPATGQFHVGAAVKIGCVNGALYYIVGATPPPSTTTTSTTPTTITSANAYGIGTISGLSPTTISVTGESPLTCEIGSSSPPLGDYHVGDAVKLGCQNHVLYGIIKSTTATTSTTTSTSATTTTTAAPTTTATGSGTITALSPSAVTVTGDRALTCTIAATGPSPADYQLGLGAHVTIGCVNGVLAHISV